MEIVNPPLCGHGEPALLHEPVAEPDHAGQVHDEETEKEKGLDDGGSVSPTTAGPVPQQPLEDEENPHSAMPPRASVGSASAPTTSPSDGAMEADTS